MFGNDFTRYEKKEETKSKNEAKQAINENSVNQNKYKIEKESISEKKVEDSNYTFMVTLYPNSKEFTFNFLSQFHDVKRVSNYDSMFATGVYPVELNGTYKNKQICISLWIRTSLRRSIMEPMWSKNSFAVLIYFDPKDPKYGSKLIELIKELKPTTKAKFIIVIDKNSMNSELKVQLKYLQDENLIQGIYQFSHDETDNNDYLINTLVNAGAMNISK